MSNPFSAVLNFFSKLFSKKTVNAINDALTKAAPYVKAAMPYVETIVALTPTQADDLALEAYKHFGVDHLFDPEADRKVAIRDLVVQLVKEKCKDCPETRILNLAVEVAYSAVCEAQAVKA